MNSLATATTTAEAISYRPSIRSNTTPRPALLADSVNLSAFIPNDYTAAERLAVITAVWAAPSIPMKTALLIIGHIVFPEPNRRNKTRPDPCTPVNSSFAMNHGAAATPSSIEEMFRDLMVFDRGGTPKQRALVELCMDNCLLLDRDCSADERLRLIRTLWIADIPMKSAYTMIGLALFPEAITQLTED